MTILLRTLARKSLIKFGNYSDLSVQNLLDRGQHKWLREAYFNLSMISFNDEILNEIGITEEHRIPKPGKDREYYKNHKYDMRGDISIGVIVTNKVQFRKAKQARNASIRMNVWAKSLEAQRNRNKRY